MSQLSTFAAPAPEAAPPEDAALDAPALEAAPPEDAALEAVSPEDADPAAGVTGAEALIRSLEEVGVDTVFGIPGGAILPAYDPLMDSAKVRHILVRHE
ncbi:hypothetical protein VM98_27660, partial [Streptomyces rubellomurinus subsp. indigoferus]